jgi:hypothetical protein
MASWRSRQRRWSGPDRIDDAARYSRGLADVPPRAAHARKRLEDARGGLFDASAQISM